ncbi:MAG TPA: DUF1016 N-terminal domain-containing protein, partial [Thermotogota bacterium]|nr:DUF1016 N-terminal domain-containing protein [Thermotogota bacterium]
MGYEKILSRIQRRFNSATTCRRNSLGHNLLIMNKIKDDAEREYYIKSTIENGWTRNILNLQIKSNAYQRQVTVAKTHNFNETLPKVMAEQADNPLKDVYMLDFLGITEPVLERELENKMIEKVK